MISNSDYEPNVLPDEGPVDLNGKAIFDQPFYGILINADVKLLNGENIEQAKVVERSASDNGLIHGTYHQDPIKIKCCMI